MVLEIFAKYLLNLLAITSALVNVVLFSITTEDTESEIIFIGFSFLMPFQVFFQIIGIGLKKKL